MMAAYSAAVSGARVTLFERNEKLGKKLFITGKGRCNVTNDCDTEEFFSKIPTNPKFLYSAVYTFPSYSLTALLNDNGLETKVERGGRVFPASDKSSDVIKTLVRMLEKAGVRVKLETGIKTVKKTSEGFLLTTDGKDDISFDRVIIATGGLSYPKTGSTGDGYGFARSFGHKVRPARPSLIPLVVREKEITADMMGLSLKNVRLTVTENGLPVFSDQGEMLFTHFGISGPLVLSASAHIMDGVFRDVKAELDLKPALSEEKLDARILRDFDENRQKQLSTVARGLFPAKLAPHVLAFAGLDGEKSVSEVTREERAALVRATKHFTLTVTGTRPIDEAVITRGGVDVRGIDPSTMQSRSVDGLYFAGELIDVDGYTGGYNLQIAFSTGYLAGLSAASED